MKKCPTCGYEGDEKNCPSCDEALEMMCDNCLEAQSQCVCDITADSLEDTETEEV